MHQTLGNHVRINSVHAFETRCRVYLIAIDDLSMVENFQYFVCIACRGTVQNRFGSW